MGRIGRIKHDLRIFARKKTLEKELKAEFLEAFKAYESNNHAITRREYDWLSELCRRYIFLKTGAWPGDVRETVDLYLSTAVQRRE